MSNYKAEQRTATITCSDKYCLGDDFECAFLTSIPWYPGTTRYHCKLYGVELEDKPNDPSLAMRCLLCHSGAIAGE